MSNVHPSQRTPESLGKPRQTLKPKTENVAAGFALALLAIGGGLAIAWFVYNGTFGADARPQEAGDKWWGAGLILVGLLVSAGGVFGGVKAWGLIGFKLTICQGGFHYTRNGKTHVFPWEDIECVDEERLEQALPLTNDAIAGSLMPKKSSRNYTVHRSDGETFYFDDNVLPRTSLLAGPLAAAAKNYDFIWRVTEKST